MTKNDILNYIYNSPLDCENTPAELENMPGDKLLELVGGVIDTKPNDGKHSYEIISIDLKSATIIQYTIKGRFMSIMLQPGASSSQKRFSMRKATKEPAISSSASVTMQKIMES